jgi:murein DD-endopeptidase MepM/ murein hydrolase activator NlpD
MPLRNLLDPVDLYASVPKTGVIQPSRYMDTLRERFKPVQEIGNVANQLSQYQAMKRDSDAQRAAFEAAAKQRDAAQNAADSWRPPAPNIPQYGGVTGGQGSASQVAYRSNGGGYANPVQGYSPSGHWGSYPVSGRTHNALDFGVPLNTTVGAPVSGKVVVAGWDSGGFGNSIRIKGNDGNYWILGHLNSLGVGVGQTVKAGQSVGLSGSTGRSSGPHLHLEARHSIYNPSSAFNFSSLFGW